MNEEEIMAKLWADVYRDCLRYCAYNCEIAKGKADRAIADFKSAMLK